VEKNLFSNKGDSACVTQNGGFEKRRLSLILYIEIDVAMRKFHVFFFACCLYSALSAQAPTRHMPSRFAMPEGVTAADYRPGHALVKVKPAYAAACNQVGIHVPQLRPALERIGATEVERAFPHVSAPSETHDRFGVPMVDLTRTYRIVFPDSIDVVSAINTLLASDVFEYAEPAYVYQPSYVPNDPDIAAQYYLPLIQAFDAWDYSKGDSTIVIGIIDTGTWYTHPELINRHKYNYADPIDGLDNDGDGYLDNFRGWDFGGSWHSKGDNDATVVGVAVAIDHGIICAGAMIAEPDNGGSIAGVGFNCRFMPIKVSIDETPLIYYGYEGVVYAADHGCQIMNLSWGGPASSKFGEDAVNYAVVNKGTMVVAAAGNTPQQLNFYPASYHRVISVPGSQTNDLFWNTTAGFGTSYSYYADVTAPARDVRTTNGSNSTSNQTGTSLAAPIVCGVAGLVKSYYPNLSMAQVAQRVRANADASIYNLNPSLYAEKMGRGRVNAFRALRDSTPSVRILDVQYTDNNDGILRAGDTVSIGVRFLNYLRPVTGLEVILSTPDWGQIEVIHDRVLIGDMGTLEMASNQLAPFKVVIRSSTAAGFLGNLRFEYAAQGYGDWEYYQMQIEPNYVNLDANRIETSVTGNGRWGYLSFPSLSQGRGLTLNGSGGLMDDAGFLIGNSATKVSNNIERPGGTTADNHFTNLSPITRIAPGLHADLEARTVYSDGGAGGAALGVQIDQRSFQWSFAPYDNFIIQEYRITNTTAAALNNLYAGMYADFEFYWPDNNTTKYDSLSRCIYNYHENFASLFNTGMALLTPDSLHGFAAPESGFGYTLAEKFTALTSPPQSAALGNIDQVQFASAGPFGIAPGDTHIVAFALVFADTLPELRTSVADANRQYWCLVRGQMLNRVDLGPDFKDCAGGAAPTLNAGNGFASYLWNTGSTASSITPSASGEYWVRVTDANGCEDYDRIQVTLNPGMSSGFTCNPIQIMAGDTIDFSDTTATAIQWGWDFGDGSSVCPIHPDVRHTYSQPGSYQVTLYVGNGVCIDTVTKTVVVDTFVSTQPARPFSDQLSLWPNPNNGAFRFQAEGIESAEAELLLVDALGRVVWQSQVVTQGRRASGTLDLGFVPAGLYFLELRAPGQRWLGKLVKE
jgi:serine protease